ncbi:MAG: hypothetical protein NBV68_03305 [Erythrobacter sp.]|uniref:hypothetical protein n=1 Tax=Erythrobacter sp. TaxID=1042 RepID=UPI0025DE06A4|nr:hypothetical protein [Erythrobacter sp.]MCL9998385.1 hypothetical protein [Erythrobacter sp.]
MPKAKAHPGQLGFDWNVPVPARGEGALAGYERRVNALVGTIIASDGRSRYAIAAAMSELLDEDVSKSMLDAYSSPAREDHRVPFTRLAALVIVTGRQDLVRDVMGEWGVSLLIGAETEIARIGQLRQRVEQDKREIRELEARARPIHEHRKGQQ